MTRPANAKQQATDLDKETVALKYNPESGFAPRLIAKGRGEIAEQILAIAKQNDVHIYESAELVELLLRLDLGDEIPESLFLTVAEIIAFAYSLKDKTLDRPTTSAPQNNKDR
ncbi:MAG: EscU/YscU/HrcU family type III secretion system export apparatus switch protein [Pontibacterium sp.]